LETYLKIRSVSCRMKSHGVTCHPTQVNAPSRPALTPTKQVGT